jgi:hypothetical protein
MAGVTNPRMISGMENERKFPKRELNVTNIRAMPVGKNCPKSMPEAMARATCPKSEILNFFMFVQGVVGFENYTINK